MVERLPKYESLHNHTILSDGEQTHLDVLVSAEKTGFGYVAFTDHDIVPDERTMKQIAEYGESIQWEIGIEMTSGLPEEIGGSAAPLFHILGLRIDPVNQELRDYCKDATDARMQRLHRTVDNLQKAGFSIRAADCIELAGEGSVGSPHISRVLLNEPSNVRLLEKIADSMRIASSHDSLLAERYASMMEKVHSGQRHPYIRDLLFADDAYLPDIYVPYLFSIDMDRTVKIIRNAGGLAVLAHWPTVRHLIPPEHLRGILERRRLDGVELRTVYNASPAQIADDIVLLRTLANDNGLITTVGVDGHNPRDFETFAKIPGALDMTVGQSEKYLSYCGAK